MNNEESKKWIGDTTFYILQLLVEDVRREEGKTSIDRKKYYYNEGYVTQTRLVSLEEFEYITNKISSFIASGYTNNKWPRFNDKMATVEHTQMLINSLEGRFLDFFNFRKDAFEYFVTQLFNILNKRSIELNELKILDIYNKIKKS